MRQRVDIGLLSDAHTGKLISQMTVTSHDLPSTLFSFIGAINRNIGRGNENCTKFYEFHDEFSGERVGGPTICQNGSLFQHIFIEMTSCNNKLAPLESARRGMETFAKIC
jgi:hypothetical protein